MWGRGENEGVGWTIYYYLQAKCRKIILYHKYCIPTFSSAVHVILVSVSVRTVIFDPVKSTILASSFSPTLDIKLSE